jgi:hypothetical protein
MYYKFNKETLLPEKVNVTNRTLTGVGVAIGLAFSIRIYIKT